MFTKSKIKIHMKRKSLRKTTGSSMRAALKQHAREGNKKWAKEKKQLSEEKKMKKFRVQWREYHTMEIEVGDEVDEAEAIRLVRLSLSHRTAADTFEAFELEEKSKK